MNNFKELSKVLRVLRKVQKESGNVFFADVIVFGGVVVVEKAVADAGYPVKVGFRSGRGDAF